MNAQDARKRVESLKASDEERLQIAKADAYARNIEQLYDQLMGKIEEAVNKRKMSVEIRLSEAQCEPEVLSDVVNKIRASGFSVAKEFHNAFRQNILNINWVDTRSEEIDE